MKLYVEGGGDAKSLQIECRRGFREFLEKAGLKGKMPGITACGGRRQAYDDYRVALKSGESAALLVDSEAPVVLEHQQPEDQFLKWQPWRHLKARHGDDWDKPANALDTDCHLMVQIMESWFLADRDAIKAFFGQDFNENALPSADRPIESLAKNDVYDALRRATQNCKTKAKYGKGEHSFKLLAKIDPAKVVAASPWAQRFVEELKKKMGV
ncbi:MAG TPA: DUF4276 family protein [Candidatus Macondimonas sp.]|nr:DUF4276 family protein [Candidatus Macondimonas sp.]